jgi:predicted negative regulator of RcsB-dependent stress response
MKPRIYCAHCNSELRWGDKFCGNCGKPVELTEPSSSAEASEQAATNQIEHTTLACETCGTVNKPGTDFCRSCGSDLRSQPVGDGRVKATTQKQARKVQQSALKESKHSSLFALWKPAAVLVVIIAAAVVLDIYVSKENIPQQPVQQQQQQTSVPQQPASANMAVLPQIEDMERQVKANPDNEAMALQLANFLSDNRFFDKAITYYQSYLQKKPKDTNARVDLGICFKETGQYDNATKEMKKALAVDPSHLFATFNLGIVALDEGKMYMDQGKMDRANALIRESNDWFNKTVALAPTSEVGKRAQQLLSQHSNTQLPSSN